MAEPQEYTVKSWKPWEGEEGLVRDNYGNYKGTVTFDEDNSEPIDATFKTQPEVGDKKYGVVDLYQTKAGKTRKGFKSAPRPDGQGFSGPGPVAAKKDWQPRDDNRIAAQWALGRAYERNGATEVALNEAKWLYDHIGQVFEEQGLKAPEPVSVEDAVAQAQARRDSEIIHAQKTGVPVPDEVHDNFGDEPINLGSIPF